MASLVKWPKRPEGENKRVCQFGQNGQKGKTDQGGETGQTGRNGRNV